MVISKCYLSKKSLCIEADQPDDDGDGYQTEADDDAEEKPPERAPPSVAEELPVGHNVTDGEQDVKPQDSQLGYRVDEQGEAGHEHLKEEPFGQVVAGVARCAAEEQPRGGNENGHEE